MYGHTWQKLVANGRFQTIFQLANAIVCPYPITVDSIPTLTYTHCIVDTTSGVFGGTYEDNGCVEGQLCLVDRGTWRAHPQKNKLDPQTLPLQRVVIAHTASEPCNSLVSLSTFFGKQLS